MTRWSRIAEALWRPRGDDVGPCASPPLLTRSSTWIALGVFTAGFLLVVFLPLRAGGWHLPGDAGDTMLNNIFLEHFYRWVTGREPSYWSARFHFPFPLTIAWSENHLGTAPIYTTLRIAGLSREAAHLGWYCIGFVANYTASYLVLRRLRFAAFPAAAGAFFFAFGLPMTNQEEHNQLLYRWCVPIATYTLYRFAHTKQLKHLTATVVLLVVQMSTNLYVGAFLLVLLAFELLLMPRIVLQHRGLAGVSWIPRSLLASWRQEPARRQFALILACMLAFACLLALAYPYFAVKQQYGFSRSWHEISTMLPRVESYLFAPNSFLWSSKSQVFGELPAPNEHGIFPGLFVVLLLLVGMVIRLERRARDFFHLNGALLAVIGVITLSCFGYSLYWFAAKLPVLGSLRAVARVQLVMMWPLAVCSVVSLDALWSAKNRRINFRALGLLLVALLVVESSAIRHRRISFADFRARRVSVSNLLERKKTLPRNPILFVAEYRKEAYLLQELAAMAVAQDRGWPTLNGYSGYAPPGYVRARSCAALPQRLLGYIRWAKKSERDYLNLIRRVVPIGFSDCQQSWWQRMPSITHGDAKLTREEFRRVQLSIIELSKHDPQRAKLLIRITNRSGRTLHTHSSKGNHVRVSWRWVDLSTNKPVGGFEARVPLNGDIATGRSQTSRLLIDAPPRRGLFTIEVSIVQEGVFWIHDLGIEPARVTMKW